MDIGVVEPLFLGPGPDRLVSWEKGPVVILNKPFVKVRVLDTRRWVSKSTLMHSRRQGVGRYRTRGHRTGSTSTGSLRPDPDEWKRSITSDYLLTKSRLWPRSKRHVRSSSCSSQRESRPDLPSRSPPEIMTERKATEIVGHGTRRLDRPGSYRSNDRPRTYWVPRSVWSVLPGTPTSRGSETDETDALIFGKRVSERMPTRFENKR